MSSIKLSKFQKNVLNKGLKFTPIPKRNVFELKKDTEDFTRKLRLLEYFSQEENEDDISLVRNKGSFCPQRDRNKTLDNVCDYLKKQNHDPKIPNMKTNISKREYAGILELKNNKDIVIKEADKGGAVVIMNTSHYVKMIEVQLKSENSSYKQTTKSCDNKVLDELKKLSIKYKDQLTKAELNYLTNFSCHTSNFYGLPKIHKSELLKEAIKIQNSDYIELLEPNDLKLRPIVAGPSCPTRRLSDLIDKILKPLVQHVKSYVRDNIHFLDKCSRENSENTTLATFDIVSLYTNIPHNYGIEALQRELRE